MTTKRLHSTPSSRSEVMDNATCPICGVERVPDHAEHCPQCDADLTCFRALDALHEAPSDLRARDERAGRRVPIVALAMAGLLGLGLLVLLGLQLRVLEQLAAGLSERTQDLALTQPDRLDELERLVEQLTHAEAPRQETREMFSNNTGFVIHEVVRGDTRWAIAQKYYGSGDTYPVLFEHNGYLPPGRLKPGQQIQVMTDPQLAREIYQRNLHASRGGVRWTSAAREGDTLRSVAARFYGRAAVAKIARLNPSMELVAGQRIEVVLE